ncbi:MAG: hypothetical protein LBR79_02930, partial [Oscillospiraceae bacterium]|nr:hypothetical protein [Oscillospiraceae bacterium]
MTLIFGLLFLFFADNKTSARILLDASDTNPECIKFYTDQNCTPEHELTTGSELTFKEGKNCLIYAKVNLEEASVENDDPLTVQYNYTDVSSSTFRDDYANKISKGLYEINFSAIDVANEFFEDSEESKDCSVHISIPNLKERILLKLKDINAGSSWPYIKFYTDQKCTSLVLDLYTIPFVDGKDTFEMYAKVDFSNAYIVGADDTLIINTTFSKAGYNFFAATEKVVGLDSVYKIIIGESNNKFKAGRGSIMFSNINVAQRSTYFINFNLPKNLQIYQSDKDGMPGDQIDVNENFNSSDVFLTEKTLTYFLIKSDGDHYISNENIIFTYITAGFNVTYTKLSSDDGGKYLITISDDLKYGSSNRNNTKSTIAIGASLLERRSFYVTFPYVHGIEFLDSSNQKLSGKKRIENFAGQYIVLAKLDSNIFQGNDLDAAKNIEFSLGEDFNIQSEYDESIKGFKLNITSYAGNNNDAHTLSLLVNSSGVKKPFVKLFVPGSNYQDMVKFYYAETNNVLSANNYRITTNILVFPGLNMNLYVSIDAACEYNIETLSLQLTNGTIASVASGDGVDFGTEYYYNKYTITQLFNDSNLIVSLDQKKYKINLLKKKAGIDQIEYEVNYLGTDSATNFGSVAGKDSVLLRKGEKINFVFKFSESGYNQLKLSELKLRVYPVKSDGTVNKIQSLEDLNVGEKAIINDKFGINNEIPIVTTQKYYSAEYEVQGIPVMFEIDGIKLDKHTVEIVTSDDFENSNYDITRLINILPNPNSIAVETADKNAQGNGNRKYIIKDQEYGTYLSFLMEFKSLEPGAGYNKSTPSVAGALTSSGGTVNISQGSDGYWKLKIVGDSTLTVTKIERNSYKITLPTINGITFKYKNVPENYTSTNTLEGYQNVPVNNQIPIKYEDYLAVAADFDYSKGWDMPRMVIKYEGTDNIISDIANSGGENFREFLVPRINGNYTLNVSVPLRRYEISFAKINTKMAKAYDAEENVLNSSNAPQVILAHGSDYKFRVEADSKCLMSLPNMQVILMTQEDLTQLDDDETLNSEIYDRGTILTTEKDG